MQERKIRYESGKPSDDLLSRLFVLKERQREVRRLIKVAHKAINALGVRACIIDYAVNFGLSDRERLWRSSLTSNDSLSKPLLIRKS